MVTRPDRPLRSLASGLSLGLHVAAVLLLINAGAVPGKPGQPDALSIDIIQIAPPPPVPEEEEAEAKPRPQPVPEPAKPAPRPPQPRQSPRPVAELPPAPPEPSPSLTQAEPETAAAVVAVPPAPKAGGGVPDDSLALYGRVVWTRIAAHKPRGVRLPGTATVTFAIAPDGSLIIAEVTGSTALDRLALETVRTAAPFPPPPPQATPAQLTFTVPFQFR